MLSKFSHRPANPSSGLSNDENIHKTIETLNTGNIPSVPLPFASFSTLHLNKFDFQTSNGSTFPTLDSGSNYSNCSKIMLKQLQACDRDDECLQDVPLKPTYCGHHVSEKSPSSSEPLSPSQQPQRWSVGKISILILACLTLSDVIFHMVDAQMESLEAPDHYDAFATTNTTTMTHHNGGVITTNDHPWVLGVLPSPLSPWL
jgi:hypothetical protein